MTFMAAACGILIVVLGLFSAGRNPTEVQSAIEIVCLVGGLILCFVAVVLARLSALGRRLDGFEVVAEAEAVPPAAEDVEPEYDDEPEAETTAPTTAAR